MSDLPIEDQRWTHLSPADPKALLICPQCEGEGQIVARDPEYRHLPGAENLSIQTCPTCRGEKNVTAEQHAQWQEAHGDLRDRVRELERTVRELEKAFVLHTSREMIGTAVSVRKTTPLIVVDGPNGRLRCHCGCDRFIFRHARGVVSAGPCSRCGEQPPPFDATSMTQVQST